MGEMEKYAVHLFGSREIGRNKSGRWEIEPPPIGGLPNARNGLVNFKLLTNLEKCGAFSTSCLACILSFFRSILAMK